MSLYNISIPDVVNGVLNQIINKVTIQGYNYKEVGIYNSNNRGLIDSETFYHLLFNKLIRTNGEELYGKFVISQLGNKYQLISTDTKEYKTAIQNTKRIKQHKSFEVGKAYSNSKQVGVFCGTISTYDGEVKHLWYVSSGKIILKNKIRKGELGRYDFSPLICNASTSLTFNLPILINNSFVDEIQNIYNNKQQLYKYFLEQCKFTIDAKYCSIDTVEEYISTQLICERAFCKEIDLIKYLISSKIEETNCYFNLTHREIYQKFSEYFTKLYHLTYKV